MNGHINGWGVISRHLQLREKNQSDLARLLHISPAAITQIKNGQFRLNPRQLHAIPGYLEFNQAACDEFFSEIFNARMQFCHGEPLTGLDNLHCTVKVERKNDIRKIPVADVEALKNFIPALESVAEYLRRVTRERHPCACRSGAVALRVREPLAGNGGPLLLIVNGDTYPVPGKPAIAAWDDGTVAVGTFAPERRDRRLLPFGGEQEKAAGRPEALRWIFPIIASEAAGD